MHLARRACLFDVLFSTLRRQLEPALDEGPGALSNHAYHRVLSDIKIALVPEAATYLIMRDAAPAHTVSAWDAVHMDSMVGDDGRAQDDGSAPWRRSTFDHVDRQLLRAMCSVPSHHLRGHAGVALVRMPAADNDRLHALLSGARGVEF